MTCPYVVILAAGQGKRMRSSLPKVLHSIGGRTLLEHVVNAALPVEPSEIAVVYGHGGDKVLNTLSSLPVRWVQQAERLGTGHAVMQAMPEIPDASTVVVLNGDVPLIQAATLAALVKEAQQSQCMSLVTARVDDPTGYGRIVRDSEGAVTGIVEQRDATPDQLAIQEINTGIMALPRGPLSDWLAEIKADNSQGEYYLTDVIALARRDGFTVATTLVDNAEDLLGVNDRVQLAILERRYQRRQVTALMEDGVTVRDPARLDIRGEVRTGNDCEIDINVVLEGEVKLGDRVRIGANCVLRNVAIGDDTEILENSIIEQTEVGSACRIGPFSRLRPDCVLADHVHIGNFVEIKKSVIQSGSKVNHLSYLGDSEVGRVSNIGAGTITCNYDGANKHKTIIGDDCFIGSGTELVAPVTIAAGTTVGAGSTITRDTKSGSLAVARSRQQTIEDWKRPLKKNTSD